MFKVRRVIFFLPVLLSLAGCAPIMSLLGYGSSSGLQIAAQIDQATLVAGGIVYVGSGKTISDHVLSNVTGDDCKITNIVSGAPLCIAQSKENSSALATSSDSVGLEQNF